MITQGKINLCRVTPGKFLIFQCKNMITLGKFNQGAITQIRNKVAQGKFTQVRIRLPRVNSIWLDINTRGTVTLCKVTRGNLNQSIIKITQEKDKVT